MKLGAAPIHDAVAVADGEVFVALEDGKILCLGSRRAGNGGSP